MIRLAWRDLAGAPAAAALTLLGLVILAFAFLLLAALSHALTAFTQSSSPVKNLMVLEGGVLHPEDSQLDPSLATRLEASLGDGVAQVTPMIFRVLKVDDHVVQIRAAAVEDWPATFGLELREGRWPRGPDELAIGAGTAHFTDWTLGDQLKIYGGSFQIVGLLDAPGSKFLTLWLPVASARDLFGSERGVQVLVATLKPSAESQVARAALEAELAGEDLAVYLEDAMVSELADALEDLRGLARLATWLAVAAVTLGAYNLTRLAADERRRALGLLRAVGFSPGSLRRYLLSRMALLAAGAFGLAWLAAGFYLTQLQGRHPIVVGGAPLPLRLDAGMAASGLLLTTAATLAGTWFSARQVLAGPVADLLGRGPGATP